MEFFAGINVSSDYYSEFINRQSPKPEMYYKQIKYDNFYECGN